MATKRAKHSKKKVSDAASGLEDLIENAEGLLESLKDAEGAAAEKLREKVSENRVQRAGSPFRAGCARDGVRRDRQYGGFCAGRPLARGGHWRAGRAGCLTARAQGLMTVEVYE